MLGSRYSVCPTAWTGLHIPHRPHRQRLLVDLRPRHLVPRRAPRWGTSEVQTYTESPSNAAVQNGVLTITPRLAGSSSNWTSSRLRTHPRHDFSCAANTRLRIEARIRLGTAPSTQQSGIWPAFWALGSAYRGVYTNWPAVGEVDILESPNGLPRVWHTLHCGTNPVDPATRPTASAPRRPFPATAPFTSSPPSTGSVSSSPRPWQNETITWFVDGVQTFRVTGATIGDARAWAALAHDPKFLLLNVAVGGSFPDAVAGARTPNATTQGGPGAAMEVDYIAIYSS
ncbi:unnamed protein product [Parascedosporium putredinis]|uniref:GH16 domain-containing protein n=1 Tax=Parascedosporium putredinis TaxID=1442378 RepID=A0A9P1HAF0_9PEZI|nr:unnamed protein product [Parascedosporium putredinis]CAI8004545.1 unnamed protein product [Parascedosporium putredinis]